MKDEDKRVAIGGRSLKSSPHPSSFIIHPSWTPADTPRQGLPVALDMASLYEQMLSALAPLPPRRGETLRDHLERLGRIRGLEAEMGKLERRMTQERQFNRKVEINSRLRALRNDIAWLSVQQETQE